jgi:hypothetical protein
LLAGFVQPRCEQLEERLALALFSAQPALSFSGLNNNDYVVAVDLNKDGLTDAVLTNYGTDTGSGAGTAITVLYGRVGGGFNRVQLSTGGTNVSSAAVADINGDTWPDLVVCNANHTNTGSVSVFANDGAGALALLGTPFSTFGNNSSRVVLADVTGDSILDAIVASFGKDNGTGTIVGANVTVFQGNAGATGHGNFTFSSSPINTLAPNPQFFPTALVVADLDGDGFKDIATTVPPPPPNFGDPQPNGIVYVFRGTGGGAFAAPTQFGSGGVLPVDIQLANLNGDNKADLVIANAGDSSALTEFLGNSVGVLLNASSFPGNVDFSVSPSLVDNTHGTFAVAIADFDLDGNADIAAVNYGSLFNISPTAFVSMYMGNGTGAFTNGSPGTYNTLTSLPGGQYLAVGNFDNNPTPDLIIAHASNRVGLLLNTTLPPPAPPSGPDLDATSDTGVSNTDDLTRDNTPAFTGTSAANVNIFLYSDGVQVGSGAADVNGNWSITTSPLTEGVHQITARSSFATIPKSDASPALAVTIDTTAPSANSINFLFETQQVVQVAWSEPISAAATNLTLSNLKLGVTVPAGDLAVLNNLTSTIGWRYVGNASGIANVLADANYQASVPLGAVTDLAGNPSANAPALPFFFLSGDANRDRKVDAADLGILSLNWGVSFRTFSQANFNYAGAVDVNDLDILAKHWQQQLVQPTGSPLAPGLVLVPKRSPRLVELVF